MPHEVVPPEEWRGEGDVGADEVPPGGLDPGTGQPLSFQEGWSSSSARPGSRMKAGTAALLTSKVRQRKADAEALGVELEEVHRVLAAVVDDSFDEELFEEIRGDTANNVLVVNLGFAEKGTHLLEVFTHVEAVKKAAEKEGLKTMASMSLEFGYDLKDPSKKNEAFKKIKAEKPCMVILAFPCTIWSRIQQIMKHRRPVEALRA